MSKIDLINFKHNYEELANLIATSWSREHESYINYTPKFLEYLLNNPEVDRDLCFAAYCEEKLISFLLAKRKNIIIDGNQWSGLLWTLAATHPEFAVYFPYLKIKNKCAFSAIEKGYDVAFGYTALGIKNGQIEEAFAKKNEFDYKLIRKVSSYYLYFSEVDTSFYISPECDFLSISEFTEDRIDIAVELIHNTLMSSQLPLFEIPSRETLSYIFSKSDHSGAFYIEYKKNIGIVGYYNYDYFEYGKMGREVALNNIFLDALDEKIQIEVIRRLCHWFIVLGFDNIVIEDTGFSKFNNIEDLGFEKENDPENIFNLQFTSFNPNLKLNSLGNNTPLSLEIL